MAQKKMLKCFQVDCAVGIFYCIMSTNLLLICDINKFLTNFLNFLPRARQVATASEGDTDVSHYRVRSRGQWYSRRCR